MKNKLELMWVGKYNGELIEPRILEEDKNKSYGDDKSENMLIHGDNLLALKAIESGYSNKIKCIYIDPPFNTGAAFEHYNDNIEHSIWINLMYKRLNILHNLLKEDGVLLIEIDDNEMPYLRVILDEIFGRDKFVAQICVKSNNISGNKTANKEKTVLRNKDNIIIYKKGDVLKVKPQYVERTRWDTHYSTYIEFDENNSVKNMKKFKDVLIEHGIIEKNQSVKEELLNDKKFYKFILEHKKSICRLVNSIPKDLKELSLSHPDEIVSITEEDNTRYAYNGSRISFLDSSINIINGEEKFTQLLGDLWTDIDFQNTQNEGGVSFPANKKPEALIRRILDMFTEEGDYVLDSFLGSGTTAAVANKMNRKWIGVEMGDHVYTHCIPRMNNVIDGTDQSGISKSLNWQGGGGYKFYELAPTLIKKDALGESIINKDYNYEMLVKAVALHEGYKYNPDKEIFWKQSVGSENSYLYVTTDFVAEKLLNSINETIRENEFLIIECTSFDSDISKKYKNIVIKKIPESLLGKCNYDVDNYNFNIIPDDEMGEEDD